jgi:hypothetical protein
VREHIDAAAALPQCGGVHLVHFSAVFPSLMSGIFAMAAAVIL